MYKKNIVLSAGIFIMLFVLCYLFPYTGDDWAWGSQIGLDRLKNWFDNYSGRYFGNLIVLALTRSNVLKAMVMSASLTGILFLIKKISGNKYAITISGLALLLMPRMLKAQAVVWTAGFANYTTSTVLTLLYIYSFYGYLDSHDIFSQKSKNIYIYSIGMFVLGLCNTLIVEHITLYNLFMSIAVIVFMRCKYKRIMAQYVSYFIGCMAGTIIMFSNSVYRSVATGQDGYRTVSNGLLGTVKRMLGNYIYTIQYDFYMNNIFVNVLILLTCIALYKIAKSKLSNRLCIVSRIALTLNTAYIVYAFGKRYLGIIPNIFMIQYLEGIFTAFSIMTLCIFALIISFYNGKSERVVFLILSLLVSVAPLLLVTPIGSRCFSFSYCVFIILFIELFSILDIKLFFKKVSYIKVVLNVMLIIVLVVHFYIFCTIYSGEKARLSYIKSEYENGKTNVHITNYKFESLIWCSEPVGDPWCERYKLFYGLSDDLNITIDK